LISFTKHIPGQPDIVDSAFFKPFGKTAAEEKKCMRRFFPASLKARTKTIHPGTRHRESARSTFSAPEHCNDVLRCKLVAERKAGFFVKVKDDALVKSLDLTAL